MSKLTQKPDDIDFSKGWKIQSSQTKYDTPWMRVGEYKAIAPTGAPATYGLVSFKNLAIGMLPIDEEGMTYLVGQHRFALGQYAWEIPEGGGAMNEDPLNTAKRELSEEVNLKAEFWEALISNVHLSNSVTDERAFGYIAWGLSACDEHELDDVEEIKVWKMPIGQAVQMAVNGEITDALSLVILLKADHLWRQGKLPDGAAQAFQAGQV